MKRFIILLPIIFLAFLLRVWQLPHTPPGLWYDEAYYSMDAVHLLDGGPWQLFFAGNNGREPIFIYWQALLIWIFGATPLTSRLIGPWVGTLTIPLVYVLARRLTRGYARSNWLAYLAAGGMAFSFWHLGLSRGGFRGILLPLVTILVFYAFWRGWQEKSIKLVILAGVALGVSQYTYLAARALPLVLALFGLVWTALHWRDKAALKSLWLTLVVMALVSAAVFAPLGWIFFNEPDLFSSRIEDVFFTPDNAKELFLHLSNAIRIFVDNGDPNWRHHLPDRPMLGWLGWLGFWPGLFICLRRARQTPYLFLLVTLLTLFLPALLSVPPAHALRLSALLPIYYIFFALGLIAVTYWISTRWLGRFGPLPRSMAAILVAVTLMEGGLTLYDYFYRWANAEETYVEYNTPLVEFVDELIGRSAKNPVIIPFQLYVHPTTRYLLHDHFVEQPAVANAASLESYAGSVQLVSLPNNFRILNVANIPELPSFVWLARSPDGQGVAYVSRPPRQKERAYLAQIKESVTPEIYQDRFAGTLAEIRQIDTVAPLLPMFTQAAPRRSTDLNWGNLAALRGYDVVPEVIRPDQPLTLNFYWRSLTDKTFSHRLFLQLIDPAGQPINQWEGEGFREDMYRWRENGLLPTQHTLWVGPDTPPGPYLVRIGFFDVETGRRLPLYVDGQPTGTDQIQLGLFYVSANGTDPRRPATPVSANFANSIELTGVTTIPFDRSTLSASTLPLTLHWQTIRPTDKPYTVFLQLLDAQGQVISGWDRQPFNGLYPTHRWSPGEVIADTFELPLPEDGLPPGSYRVITGFYDVETGQRLQVVDGGDFVELLQFTVE